MGNFKKTVWTSILFFSLLAPFVVVLILSMRKHISPVRIQAAQMAAASQEAGTTNPLILTLPTTQPADSAPGASLLAAGDGRTLWVVHPVPGNDHGTKTRAYELLQRASNTGMWLQAQSDSGAYFGGFPKGLAAMGTGSSPRTAAEAWLFTNGSITRFSLVDHALLPTLPAEETLIAEAGGIREIFALTFGKHIHAATMSNAVIVPLPDVLADETPATTRASSGPATTTASSVAITASENTYWFHDGQWLDLPAMGEAGVGEGLMVPGEKTMTAMVAHGGELTVMWVNPGAQNELVTRSIEYGKRNADWTEAVVSHLPESIPEGSRLLTLTLDKSAYVLWPVFANGRISLHGGRLESSVEEPGKVKLEARNYLRPMNLGPSVTGQDAMDVAVGPAENSIAVLVAGEKGALTCQLFNDQGEATGKAAAVEAKSPQRGVLLAQDVAMGLLLLMAGLSIWQWNHRPAELVLPAHMVLAPLYLRAIAFLIDLAIPAAIVVAIFGMGDSEMLGSAWMNSLITPDELLKTPQLLYTLLLYVVLAMGGELFFRRSIGKAIVGLQVLMLDGKAPTVAAVVLRNLVRIPEMLPGILGIYVLMSESRQRFGDWLAGTVVVSQQAPETPEDPDAGEKSEKKLEKKDEMAGAGRGERLR